MPERRACALRLSAGGRILGSITLTWVHLVVIALAAVGLYILELVAFLRATRRQAEQEQKTQQRLDAMAAEVASLREQVSGLGADLSAVRRSPQSSGQYREAVEMAEQGLDAAAVADKCGISRAEADLIVALYRSRAA